MIRTKKINKPLNVINFDETENKKSRLHGHLFPDTYLRMAILGPSGIGKTNLLIALLTQPEGINYKTIYIFSKTVHQKKYVLLQKAIEKVPGLSFIVCNTDENEGEDDTLTCDRMEENSVVIFDDYINKKLFSYFTMSRHYKINVIVLSQSYLFLNRHYVRSNLNYLIIFKMDLKTVKYIFDEHILGNITFTSFLKLCEMAWKKIAGFLAVDLIGNKYYINFREEVQQ